jgi:hypothetical protein
MLEVIQGIALGAGASVFIGFLAYSFWRLGHK